MSMEQYHAEFGVEGEINRYYSCKICNTNVVWRLFNIRKHMESQHELSLDQYGSAYESEHYAKDQKSVSRRDSQVSQHKNHIENSEGNEEAPQNEEWYEGETLQQYQCLICNAKIAHKYNNISSHMILVHDLSIQEYEAEYLGKNTQETNVNGGVD